MPFTLKVILFFGHGFQEGWREAVEIAFRDHKTERACNSEKEARRRWGQNGPLVLERIALLLAAETLADLRAAPGKLHALTGDRAGQFAFALHGPHRLTFEIANAPVPLLAAGGVDLAKVTAVRILEVVQYHG